jgi:hypothetical protein
MMKAFMMMLSVLLLSSCTNIGPKVTQSDRFNYNSFLQYSDNQQMLLNIVRLRYLDNIYLLTVSSVVTQMSLTQGVSGIIAAPTWSGPNVTNAGQIEGAVAYQEKPTVTYLPLQGKEYVIQLMTPIHIKIIYLLLRSGWGVNFVLRAIVQKMGPFENAIIASRGVTQHIPIYESFLRLSWIFHQLQYGNNLNVTYEKVHDRFAIKFSIPHLSKLDNASKKVLAKIGITEAAPYVWFVDKNDAHPHHVTIETRTMLGLLNYLSKGVSIPDDQIRHKVAPITYLANGKPFDWRKVLFNMLEIKSSNVTPQNAYISIFYKGYWYYIADNDFKSKETFSLISTLSGFQQGHVSQSQPIFTIN